MADCKFCGKPLLEGERPNKRFCDVKCQRGFHSAEWRAANPKSPNVALRTSAVAERNLLLVSMDLLKHNENFQLYRALFPGQDSDLLVTHHNFPGISYRVEVVTGTRTARGKLVHAKRDTTRYDVLAVVMRDDSVVYDPPYGEWGMMAWELQ